MFYILAFLSGFIVVFNIVVNSLLAKKTDIYLSTFSNYLFGSIAAIVVSLMLGELSSAGRIPASGVSVIYYAGGIFGVAVVTIFNYLVHRIPVIYSTLLAFIGQLGMGIGLDLALGNAISYGKAAGLALMTAGFVYNLGIDRKDEKARM